MALKVNGGRLYTNVNRVFSGVTTIYGGGLHTARFNFIRATGVLNNFRSGQHAVANETSKAGLPNGITHPMQWWPAKTAGALSSRNEAESTSGATGALAGGKAVAGTAASTSTATGEGQLISSVTGTAASTSTATINVYATKALSGTAASTSTASLTKNALAWVEGTAASTAGASMTPRAVGAIAGESTTVEALSPTGLANAVMDALIEAGLTFREATRIIAAATAGKVSGAGTTTVTIRSAVADDADRIVATVDGDGNRSAITYDLG